MHLKPPPHLVAVAYTLEGRPTTTRQPHPPNPPDNIRAALRDMSVGFLVSGGPSTPSKQLPAPVFGCIPEGGMPDRSVLKPAGPSKAVVNKTAAEHWLSSPGDERECAFPLSLGALRAFCSPPRGTSCAGGRSVGNTDQIGLPGDAGFVIRRAVLEVPVRRSPGSQSASPRISPTNTRFCHGIGKRATFADPTVLRFLD